MIRRVRSFILMSISSLLVSVTPCMARSDLQNLLQNSPFGQRQNNSPEINESTPLEFRGVLTESGVAYFSIFEAATSRSAWVRLNEESSRDFTAKSYDGDNRQLTIEYQGRDLVLSLAADSTPTPVSTTSAAAAPQPEATKAPQPSVSEAQRLNNIAAEIKRRRALRQQAINQTKQKQ